METFDLRKWKGFREAGGNEEFPVYVDQIVIDSRQINTAHSLFIALPGNQVDGHEFISHAIQQGARYVIVNYNWPGTSSQISLLRVTDPLKALQEIASAYRSQMPAQVIGIVGTHGKTMVKDLLQAMCGSVKKTVASPGSFNSQIGVPLSLLTIHHDDEIALIEAAVSRTNEMEILAKIISPNHAILTQLGNKHLDTFGNLQVSVQEIFKLLIGISKEGWVLLPNHELVHTNLHQLLAKPIFWNRSDVDLPVIKQLPSHSHLQMDYQICFPDGKQFEGRAEFGFYYFLDLINISVKAAWKIGISSEKIISVLKEYVPEPIRTEIWKSDLGTTFINDTYCSDPLSVDQALRLFKQEPSGQTKTFLFNGMRGSLHQMEKHLRHIGKVLAKADIHRLILAGDHSYSPLIEELHLLSSPIKVSQYKTLEQAFTHIRPELGSCETVLIKGTKKISLDLLAKTFNDSISNNQCMINLAAIQANISTIRNTLPPQTRMMVMVKALAYGTDDVRMARFLETCSIDILGVSYVDEGAALRRAGTSQAIFVINTAIYEVHKVVKWNLEVGVSEKEIILALAKEAKRQDKIIHVHLHIDTGMGRFGCRIQETLDLAELIMNTPSLFLEGVMTHFACADDPLEDSFTHSQIERFKEAIHILESQQIPIKWRHAANSSGALRFPIPEFNMVRIGLAVYGLYASAATRQTLHLRLALSLLSRIVGINVCKKGDTISYGRCYMAKRDIERIAVLPIGYFDGLHRNYSGKGHVLIRGQKAPMVGKICMDFMMIDVTDIPSIKIGDPVLIFGEDEHGQYLAPEEVATRGDSIVHELITCLGPRIERVFIYEEDLKPLIAPN